MSNHYYSKYGKEKIQLTKKHFAAGGEGQIYKIIDKKKKVAKIFYPKRRTQQRYTKLKYLIQHPPKDLLGLVWIEDILLDKNGEFVGYLMPEIKGYKLELFCQTKPHKSITKAFPKYKNRSIDNLKPYLQLAYKVAETVEHLQLNSEYIIGDLKPDNILIDEYGDCHLLDLDSIGVYINEQEFYPPTVITPEYAPPEHQQANPEKENFTVAWDNFSLGVILYKLLFGIHPYAASSKGIYQNYTTLHQKIEKGLFVHSRVYEHHMLVVPEPHQLYTKVAQSIQNAFQNCFVKGTDNLNLRPSAAKWVMILKGENTVGLDFLLEPSTPTQKAYLPIESIDLSPNPIPKKAIIESNSREEIFQAFHQKSDSFKKKADRTVIIGLAVYIVAVAGILATYHSIFGIFHWVFTGAISLTIIGLPLIYWNMIRKSGDWFTFLLEKKATTWQFGLTSKALHKLYTKYENRVHELNQSSTQLSKSEFYKKEQRLLLIMREQQRGIAKKIRLDAIRRLRLILQLKRQLFQLVSVPLIAGIYFAFFASLSGDKQPSNTAMIFAIILITFSVIAFSGLVYLRNTPLNLKGTHFFITKADQHRCMLAAILENGGLAACDAQENFDLDNY